MVNNVTLFEAFLNRHDDTAWSEVIASLLPSIHPVDRAATRIWFAFFPAKLAMTLKNSPDPATVVRELQLLGKYRLEDQADSSAEFLYGHRYWPLVKSAVLEHASAANTPSLALAEQILEVARQTAERLAVDASLLVGITAVAFMTLQQVGYETFRRPMSLTPNPKWTKSPDRILEERNKVEDKGWFGFLKSVNKRFTVTFRENDPEGTFKLINMQELTTAAAMDKRDYRSHDPRCVEGPIPVQCRSAACGTCWVAILAGTERLSEPADLEIHRMKDFGYSGFTPDKDSIIRLACQTKCYGNVSIVIPPWNGVVGKLNLQG